MRLSDEFIEELELLNLYELDDSFAGIKIHHEAAPARISAARRLFEKKMTTLIDGGFLTPLGIEAAEHVQTLVTMLQPSD